MSSTSANAPRRKPQQARATLRRAKFLEVAAGLIAEAGFDAVTMTAIAEGAGASIGTLYDYFPDKQTLALALLTQYVMEADEHWKRLLQTPPALKKAALADLFVEGALEFARERPAYLALFAANFHFPRSAASRRPLRRVFAAAIQRVNPKLTDERAFVSAQVVVELIKGLWSVCKQIDAKETDRVTVEFKRLMRYYLSEVVE